MVGGWEFYLRQKGVPISYDDAAELWSDKRAKVYGPSDGATVFIGSSRIKYDLDINTWRKITGKDAIQLAMEGNSPLTILEDLGNDPEFKGNLVVDITEELFFALAPPYNTQPQGNINYYHKETYAQKASFQLSHIVESHFVFLNKKFLSLNAVLDNLSIPNRPGVMGEPRFPMDFWCVDFDRQDRMSSRFLTDKDLQHRVTDVWSFFLGIFQSLPPPKDNPVPVVLQKAKHAVDKIRARGGDVLFIRTPSSGYFWEKEQLLFKKERFWNPLIVTTHCKGIYFTDYPTINQFKCIEWSHLSPAQAVVFTTEFIKLLPQSFVN